MSNLELKNGTIVKSIKINGFNSFDEKLIRLKELQMMD